MVKLFIDNGCTQILKYVCTIKETSMDNRKKENILYMIDDVSDENKVVNFDRYTQDQISEFKSNDALFWLDRDFKKIQFVEFKNGQMNNIHTKELRLKLYDSMILLANLLNTSLNKLKDNVFYVVVFNDSYQFIRNEVQDSAKYSNEKKFPEKFKNMKNLENVLVKKVDAMTVRDFKKKFLI